MRRSSRSLLPLLGMAALLMGAKGNVLVKSPMLARAAIPSLKTCAEAEGLPTEQPGPWVLKVSQGNAIITYQIKKDKGLVRAIAVDGVVGPPARELSGFPEAQQTSERLWSCARAGSGAAAMPSVEPASSTGAEQAVNSSGVALIGEHCIQLFQCYVEISRALCGSRSLEGCDARVEVEGTPSDEMCLEMLDKTDALISPMRMLNPSLQKPTVCSVR